ncbi:MAG: hypothetical protein U9Q77_00355 [Candidatus Marinimicrobia bacterium]|nr:hypothetical protein [Candidatus Neomarinimicrobiota bacterium]
MYKSVLSDACLEVELPRKALKYSKLGMIEYADDNITKPRYGNRLPKFLKELTIVEMSVLAYIHETILELIRLSVLNKVEETRRLGHASHNLQFILMKSDEHKTIDEGQPLFVFMEFVPVLSDKYVEFVANIRGMTKLKLIYEVNENLDIIE